MERNHSQITGRWLYRRTSTATFRPLLSPPAQALVGWLRVHGNVELSRDFHCSDRVEDSIPVLISASRLRSRPCDRVEPHRLVVGIEVVKYVPSSEFHGLRSLPFRDLHYVG